MIELRIKIKVSKAHMVNLLKMIDVLLKYGIGQWEVIGIDVPGSTGKKNEDKGKGKEGCNYDGVHTGYPMSLLCEDENEGRVEDSEAFYE